MVSARELARRPHSWRNFETAEFIEAIAEGESDADLRVGLQRIESGRFQPFLENTSSMFSRLDRDERRLFTRRNPDLVQWMSVYNRIHDYNPYEEWVDLAKDLLPEWSPPPFERPDIQDGRTLLDDMMVRRRSYRNWSPFEFMEIARRRGITLTPPQIRELGLFTPEIRGEIDDPREVDGKLVVRGGLLPRVEAGRFQPVLRAGHKFFAPLDPDERREFARRNPGIMVWISVWGFSEDQIWGEQLFPLSDVEWPTLSEEGF